MALVRWEGFLGCACAERGKRLVGGVGMGGDLGFVGWIINRFTFLVIVVVIACLGLVFATVVEYIVVLFHIRDTILPA